MMPLRLSGALSALMLVLCVFSACSETSPFATASEESEFMAQPTIPLTHHDASDAEMVRSQVDAVSGDSPVLAGAYWYPWFGPGRQHWEEGYVGEPVLGEYDSADHEVIQQQVAWAADHGVDFFAASWWGPGSKEDTILSASFPEVVTGSDFRFAVLYESAGRLGMEDDYIDLTDDAVRQTLMEDVAYLARTYFSRPNHLRVEGRPVLFLYLTRTFIGDIQGSMDAVRDAEFEA